MRRIGVVTGLEFEAAVVRADARAAGVTDRLLLRAGLGHARARQAAEALIAEGVQALLSFGIAGGLAPSVGCGSIIVADTIKALQSPTLACSKAWAARLAETLQPTMHGALAHTDSILASATDKARMLTQTNALAADMESYGVGEAAVAAGLPFAALRVVADTAEEHLPEIALHAVAADGSLKLFETLARVARSPAQIPALIRLGRSTGHARQVLRRISARASSQIFFVEG